MFILSDSSKSIYLSFEFIMITLIRLFINDKNKSIVFIYLVNEQNLRIKNNLF